jgi:hypothetical protein
LKTGAQRSALDVPSWALKVECFPCGSGAQCVNISGESLPVKGRGNLHSRRVPFGCLDSNSAAKLPNG